MIMSSLGSSHLGGSSSNSKPRPIHQLHRDLRSSPDEAEPSYSYEQESFLAQKEEDVEDAFHRNFQSNRRDSSGSMGIITNNHNSTNNNTASGAAAANGSFWRVETVHHSQSSATNKASHGGGDGEAGPSMKSVSPLNSPLHQNSRSRTSGSQGSSRSRSSSKAAGGGGGGATGLLGAALAAASGKDTSEGSGSISMHQSRYERKDSSSSKGGGGGGGRAITSTSIKKSKKDITKHRHEARRQKIEALSESDLGHIVEAPKKAATVATAAIASLSNHGNMTENVGGSSEGDAAAAEQASWPKNNGDADGESQVTARTSDTSATASGSSLLFGKPSSGSVLLGKSSSLIFPTGVEPTANSGRGTSIGSVGRGSSASSSDYAANNLKRRKVNLLLDQCETVRFPFKKKLILSDLNLAASDIPVKDLCGTPLGQSLHKLSLAGNRLGYIPAKLVTNLPMLKHFDLSQCELHQLPETWSLPNLRRLNLSHNRLTDFPEESMLEGLPELQELNMYGNKVAEIIIPHQNGSNSNKKLLLSKLETLNLGYNDLSYLPDDLDILKSLRTLKVMNNFLEKVPMRVCDMDLKLIDVSSNPVIQPPIETCERGIFSMKRYYHCLRMEENQAASNSHGRSSYYEDFQKGVKKTKKKVGYSLLKAPKLLMPGGQRSPTNVSHTLTPRQISEESVSYSSAHTASSAPPQMVSHSSPDTTSILPSLPDDRQLQSNSSIRHDRDGNRFAHYKEQSAHAPNRSFSLEDYFEPTQARIPSTADSVQSSKDDGSSVQPQDLESYAQHEAIPRAQIHSPESITVNDTLKVVFVGMAMVGKTSMIKRLIGGEDAVIPSHDDRTVGVDIYEWDNRKDKRFEHIDSRIEFEDKELERAICEAAGTEEHNVNVKFSVWDFAGQHVYHATHELFFSPRALYVLVWDMGATNRSTLKRSNSRADERGAFKLSYDSDEEEESEEEEDDFNEESEERRADRALERDIDEKVQFWVDCIQSSAPGAAILPVASFNDHFDNSEEAIEEAKRRCIVMKNRLLKHEERRIEGVRKRLKEYYDQNRANDEGAVRLQKLLCSFTRPKLIFGEDNDPVVRVSGSKYTGFGLLTEKIVNIATGRYRGQWQHPVFRGHIGARIPRMRLEVREAVRTLRNRFKVVEWGYFLDQLKDRGLTSVEDISDALHFLTNVGELSYFGAVYTDKQTKRNMKKEARKVAREYRRSDGGPNGDALEEVDDTDDEDDEYDDNDEDGHVLLSVDDTTIQMTEDSSLSPTDDDWNVNGLSQFVFLNPRWLVAAVACILRHDLDREIQETRRSLNTGPEDNAVASIAPNFYDAHFNCPVITARDACMLWQAKKITKKAAERALKSSNNMTVTPFEFLQLLLIRFGVFVPIDLSIDRALLGGKDYASHENGSVSSRTVPSEVSTGESMGGESPLKAKFFFLPSLLGPGEPAEAWTYKNSESWKITLAHSILFPDGVPPGLMERITASVLSNIYAVAHRSQQAGGSGAAFKGILSVKEVLCWRTAFYLKLGTQTVDNKESIVEIFTDLVDRESNLCVGSDFIGVGMRRLITSAKGQVGDRGRKIWEGGYLLVHQSIRRVMLDYGGLEYEKQGFCTECLAKNALSKTSSWDFTVIRAAVKNGDGTMRCRDGHRVETSLIAGPSYEAMRTEKSAEKIEDGGLVAADPIVPVKDLLRGVVVVGLFDGKTRKVVRVGSGFIVDRKRGLIVTASHTLMNIWGDKNSPFGENYYGLRQGKVVIGVIPREKETSSISDSTMAVFRYFAMVVAKDPSIDRGECHLDACVLRITTRMENDVGGEGEDCGDQPEQLLLNNLDALKKEKLQQLKITEKVELDEQVRILGYNQGGEGLLGPGENLNRYVDFARGYVCKVFSGDMSEEEYQRHRFKPRKEIVVICPTIGGHSGGPCVNQQGEVIGILSRADPAESQRCYLVPTYEWKSLVKQAKNNMV